jgi:hypothetical protein
VASFLSGSLSAFFYLLPVDEYRSDLVIRDWSELVRMISGLDWFLICLNLIICTWIPSL